MRLEAPHFRDVMGREFLECVWKTYFRVIRLRRQSVAQTMERLVRAEIGNERVVAKKVNAEQGRA